MLEDAGLETWAVDILGWGFSDLGILFCSSTFAIFIFQKDFANKDSGFAHSFIPLCFLVIFKEGFLRVMQLPSVIIFTRYLLILSNICSNLVFKTASLPHLGRGEVCGAPYPHPPQTPIIGPHWVCCCICSNPVHTNLKGWNQSLLQQILINVKVAYTRVSHKWCLGRVVCTQPYLYGREEVAYISTELS